MNQGGYMFTKYILALSMLFSFSALADNMDAKKDKGFNGSFELKYKPDLAGENLNEGWTYRARASWNGEVNDQVMWKLGLTSNVEQEFSNFALNGVNLEQAYVKYSPLKGLKIKVGKFAWHTKFSRSGVLYDDDLYPEGVIVKYKHNSMFAKVGLLNLEDFKGPFDFGDAGVLKAFVGTHQEISNVNLGVHVGAMYDGVFANDVDSATTIAQAGVSLSTDSMGLPVGVSANYMADIEAFGDNDTYSVGLNLNKGADLSAGLNYYMIDGESGNLSLVDNDYVTLAEGDTSATGVAARVQYEAWENANIVAKYNHSLDEANKDAPHSVAVEFTFNF